MDSNPLLTSGSVHPYQLDESIVVSGVSGEYFHFLLFINLYFFVHRYNSCMQTALTLIRCLDWVYNVCILPKTSIWSTKGYM